jgi:hypothetical protein
LKLLAHRIVALPESCLCELRYSAPGWLVRNLDALAEIDPRLAWAVWDALFDAIVGGGEATTESGLGDMMVAGVPQLRSRRTYEHALNSPIGELTQVVIRLAAAVSAQAGLPAEARERLALAMEAPGEGGDHAVCIVFSRLPWLYHAADRKFAESLIPLLDPDGPKGEPAWSGYLSGQNVGGPDLFALVRAHFLAAYRCAGAWPWSDSPYGALAEFLVAVLAAPGAHRFVSHAQARSALQAGGEPACRTFLDATYKPHDMAHLAQTASTRLATRGGPADRGNIEPTDRARPLSRGPFPRGGSRHQAASASRPSSGFGGPSTFRWRRGWGAPNRRTLPSCNPCIAGWRYRAVPAGLQPRGATRRHRCGRPDPLQNTCLAAPPRVRPRLSAREGGQFHPRGRRRSHQQMDPLCVTVSGLPAEE